jgi:cobaltochelatase CobS
MIIKHSVRTVRKPCSKCHSTDLYWGHDELGPTRPGAHYCTEHSSANWTLINRDGTKHDCQHTGETDQPTDTDTHDDPGPPTSWTWVNELEPIRESGPPAPAEAPAATPVPSASNDAMAAFQAFMTAIAPKVDASQVHAIVDERLRGLVLPVRVEVSRNGGVKPVEGLAHKMLPVVITILATGQHVMMVGPAGTGKSHIASQAAEALGLPGYSISLSPQTPTSALLGYCTATGDYVRSLFREAYENGGVFHFDEVDNSHPSVLATINAALANGHMAFPDGMVKRSPEFRCVASANTYGNGPDRAYVGRQAMDLATKDRFEIVDIPVDEALEEALCMGTGLDGTKVRQVLAYVRYLRIKALEYKLPLSFSPRRSHGACKLLAAGMSVPDVTAISVRRGITDTDWRKVSDGAPRF